MRARRIFGKLLALFLLGLAASSSAVMLSSGYDDDANSDPDFEIALSAVAREDWARAIEALEKAVQRRPWDDDAHTLLGYAHRKRGDFQASLKSYARALNLNPHHRGALAYLGEAYLELGQRRRARETLERLAEVCQQQFSSETSTRWQALCPEWRALAEALRSAR